MAVVHVLSLCWQCSSRLLLPTRGGPALCTDARRPNLGLESVVPNQDVLLSEAIALSPTFFNVCQEHLGLRALSVQDLVDLLEDSATSYQCAVPLLQWLGSKEGSGAMKDFLGARHPVQWLLQEPRLG